MGTWKEIEGHLIKPFLNLLESDCPGDRTKALESKGYGTRSEGNWGEYGLSKAAVNCYTIELGKRFPHITSTSCSPGFIETDLTRGFATRSGKTPQEMGMLTVEMGRGCPVPCVPYDWRPHLPARLHQRLVLWVGLSSQPPSQVQKSWHGCLWRRIPLKPITG